ncbi:MAG: maleylacetate reductase [Pseudomonadota bacterium]|nr:maleylacetate reductase [Pseudomonadota bacterium]
MKSFNHVNMPCRVLHGSGRVADLPAEIKALGAERVMFCCTKSRVPEIEKLAARLGNRVAGICDAAKIFVPIQAVEIARKMAANLKADCVVSYGGGTAVGLAKATALEHAMPIISIVTTYSGSETTALQGIIGRDGVRTNYRDMAMLPRVLIYDPELMLNVPLDVSIASGFNSISHAVSSYLGKDANPVADMFSENGIRTMSKALVKLARDPRNIQARSDAMHGAWLCGMTLMSSGTTIHHKIAHVLGGGFDLPHGPTHAVVLPHSTSYNRDAAPDAMAGIGRAFGVAPEDAPRALFDLLGKSGAVPALKDLGLPESALDEAADRIMIDRYFNPRDYDRDAIRALLQDAWEGCPPSGV